MDLRQSVVVPERPGGGLYIPGVTPLGEDQAHKIRRTLVIRGWAFKTTRPWALT